MAKGRHLFTSESVTEGHPDKICDQISDAVLDAIIAKDPPARVACETLVTNGLCIVAGEITTGCYIEIPEIVRGVIKDIRQPNMVLTGKPVEFLYQLKSNLEILLWVLINL